MLTSNKLTPNEILEIHELLNSNILGVKKFNASLSTVQDQNLKSLLQDSLNNKKTKIQEIQDFINSQVGVQNNQNSNQNNQNQNNNQGNDQSQ